LLVNASKTVGACGIAAGIIDGGTRVAVSSIVVQDNYSALREQDKDSKTNYKSVGFHLLLELL